MKVYMVVHEAPSLGDLFLVDFNVELIIDCSDLAHDSSFHWSSSTRCILHIAIFNQFSFSC